MRVYAEFEGGKDGTRGIFEVGGKKEILHELCHRNTYIYGLIRFHSGLDQMVLG